MKPAIFSFISCVIFLTGYLQAVAQPVSPQSEAGLPVIQNFSPKDYNAYSQNWAIVQGHDGVMYFGNGSGVLVYDGVNWRLIPVSNNTVVRSLAVDETGRVYVGARGELGYLAPDENGSLRYVSLLNFVTPEARDFGDVWETHVTSRGVHFRTSNYLFLLKQSQIPDKFSDKKAASASDTLRYWYAKDPNFGFSNNVADTIFISLGEGVLCKLVDDSLRVVPLASDISQEDFYSFLPLQKTGGPGTNYLALSRRGIACIYDGSGFKRLKDNRELQSYVQSKYFFRSAAISNGMFALATASGGVVIIDEQPEVLQILTKATGLPDDGVYFTYADREGGLWLALNNGLARVIFPAPLTAYTENLGITSNVESVVRHKGLLYAATGNGLYYLSTSENPSVFSQFELVPKFNLQTWSLLSTKDGLIVATTSGVYLLTDNRKAQQLARSYTFSLHQWQHNGNFIFLGTNDGLHLLQKTGGHWQFAGRFPGISQQIRSIVEESGVLWLGTRSNGYLRVTFPADFVQNEPDKIVKADSAKLEIAHFVEEQGVPPGYTLTYEAAGKVVFATSKGLRRFEAETGRFLPDSSFGAAFADTSRWFTAVHQDQENNIWITGGKGTKSETVKVVHRADGYDHPERAPFQQISEMGGAVNTIYADPEDRGAIWFGTGQNLLRYDAKVSKNYEVDFPCLVRRVTAEDSVAFSGTSQPGQTQLPEFDYASHNLRFEYAAPSFEAPGQTLYQTLLEGFDDKWSRWANETQKDYTNIPEGNYTFRVRAKNIYQHLSSEGRYTFAIQPPWYRTFWAYSGYLIFFAASVFLLVRWRVARVQAHARHLEGIIAERTAELADKNDKLQEMDTLKSRFFANISHEFRTPLTLILGHIEGTLPQIRNKDVRKRLNVVLRNTTKLRRLINQLLDLSKFEAGQMDLRAAKQDIIPVLRTAIANFESHAKQRDIALTFSTGQAAILLYFEQDKIEKVMYNLLSNALKFTPPGGQVAVKVDVEQKIEWEKRIRGGGKSLSPGLQFGGSSKLGLEQTDGDGEVKITVRDSGIGIPPESLPNIFDRFYQANPSDTREYEGTGIGLALTQELVQLHGGMISVESNVKQGTTFTVKLPLGKGHLAAELIVEHDESSAFGKDAPAFTPVQVDTTREQTGEQPSSKPLQADAKIVLIVEDNADMRRLIRDNLSSEYHILEAENGVVGFDLAEKHTPDVIVTDVMMPVMDGYTLTHNLRTHETTSHIPIIMLTAKAGDEDKFEGLEKGVDAYLTKPFNKQELLIRMRKLIELRQQLLARVHARPMVTASEVMVTSMDQQFLERLQKIVEENMEDESFQVEDMRRLVGLSRGQLQRKLTALLDCSPVTYLRRVRLERAKQLLEKNAGTVSEICYQVGYGNVSAFARAFREAFGETPSSVRSKTS